MSQSAAIYDSYKARIEANNVKPEIVKGREEVWNILQANGCSRETSVSNTTKFWDNDYQGMVFNLADGRVIEYSTDNSAFRIPLIAIFPTKESYDKYQKAMPRYFYMNY
jgi:hypothetical protein